MWDIFFMLGMLVFGLFLTRLWFLFYSVQYDIEKKRSLCKTMVVIGSGGHTSEMLKMLQSLTKHYVPRIYILADTDKRSQTRVEEFEDKFSEDKKYVLVRVQRSREVRQSWFSTLYTTLLASLRSIFILWRHQPDMILCNGPGTCVPICGAAFLLKIFFVVNTKIVFIESICRVKSLSLSGKILYYFADRILVQWPELIKGFPKAEYIGRLV